MTYHFYFKNSEAVYETEYMQSLKQFAVQEVFPAYDLTAHKSLTKYSNSFHFENAPIQIY